MIYKKMYSDLNEETFLDLNDKIDNLFEEILPPDMSIFLFDKCMSILANSPLSEKQISFIFELMKDQFKNYRENKGVKA